MLFSKNIICSPVGNFASNHINCRIIFVFWQTYRITNNNINLYGHMELSGKGCHKKNIFDKFGKFNKKMF